MKKYTLYVLNTQFLDETRREDTRSESTTEDGTELGIKTTNAHILKLEIRRNNRIRCSPRVNNQWRTQTGLERQRHSLLRTRLDLDRRRRILNESHIRPLHYYSRIIYASPSPRSPLSLRQLHDAHALHRRLQVLAMELKHEYLSDREDDTGERLDEVTRHLVGGELFRDLEAAFEEADFDGEVGEEGG